VKGVTFAREFAAMSKMGGSVAASETKYTA
jgi:hypothetical protein